MLELTVVSIYPVLSCARTHCTVTNKLILTQVDNMS